MLSGLLGERHSRCGDPATSSSPGSCGGRRGRPRCAGVRRSPGDGATHTRIGDAAECPRAIRSRAKCDRRARRIRGHRVVHSGGWWRNRVSEVAESPTRRNDAMARASRSDRTCEGIARPKWRRLVPSLSLDPDGNAWVGVDCQAKSRTLIVARVEPNGHVQERKIAGNQCCTVRGVIWGGRFIRHNDPVPGQIDCHEVRTP